MQFRSSNFPPVAFTAFLNGQKVDVLAENPSEMSQLALAGYEDSNDAFRKQAIDHKDHYEQSRREILEGCKGLKGRVLILGFGCGLDIPFQELISQFDEVTVVDIDRNNMKQAVNALSSNQKKKVRLVVADLTGCINACFTRIFDKMDRLEFPEFAPEISRVLCAQEIKRLELPKNHYNYVISSMVIHNLHRSILACICQIMLRRYQRGDNIITKTSTINFLRFNNSIQHHHFEDMGEWVKPDGRIYVSYPKGEYLLEGEKQIEHPDPLLPDTLDIAKKHFKVKQTREWKWERKLEHRTRTQLLVIQSFLCQKKPG